MRLGAFVRLVLLHFWCTFTNFQCFSILNATSPPKHSYLCIYALALKFQYDCRKYLKGFLFCLVAQWVAISNALYIKPGGCLAYFFSQCLQDLKVTEDEILQKWLGLVALETRYRCWAQRIINRSSLGTSKLQMKLKNESRIRVKFPKLAELSPFRSMICKILNDLTTLAESQEVA